MNVEIINNFIKNYKGKNLYDWKEGCWVLLSMWYKYKEFGFNIVFGKGNFWDRRRVSYWNV